MFRFESENNTVNEITTVLDTVVIPKSHKNMQYVSTVAYLWQWSQSLINKVLIAYEVKLNKVQNKYPDFILMGFNKWLRIEVKDKQSLQSIINEINSIDKLDCEMWFVICGGHNISTITKQATKRNKKIKIVHIKELSNKVKAYFKELN